MSTPGDNAAAVEYCELELQSDGGDDRRQRGWRQDGASKDVDAYRSLSRRVELYAEEGAPWAWDNRWVLFSRDAARRAVPGFLNQVAAEGWHMVACFSRPGSSFHGGALPWNHFLLFRETPRE